MSKSACLFFLENNTWHFRKQFPKETIWMTCQLLFSKKKKKKQQKTVLKFHLLLSAFKFCSQHIEGWHYCVLQIECTIIGCLLHNYWKFCSCLPCSELSFKEGENSAFFCQFQMLHNFSWLKSNTVIKVYRVSFSIPARKKKAFLCHSKISFIQLLCTHGWPWLTLLLIWKGKVQREFHC